MKDMAPNQKPNWTEQGIFGAETDRRVFMPSWKETLRMCWLSVRNRSGRYALVLMAIVVVVAFLMSSYAYQRILFSLSASADIHVQALLERSGLFLHDPGAMKERMDRRIWLMMLSSILCLLGITNTMLMSVTERMGEIGTLKCLGALNRFIVRLILTESMIIGFSGSVAGAVAGYLLTLIQIGLRLEFSAMSLHDYLAPLLVGAPIAVLGGSLMTVLAASYPTYVAARMQPVEAMRVQI